MKSNKIRKKLIISAGSQIILWTLVIFLMISIQNKNTGKIGVIRTSYLLENYKGMIEANTILSIRITERQGNLDTLKVDIEKALKDHNLTLDDLEKLEIEQLPKKVKLAKENFEKYFRIFEENNAMEREKLIQGVLNQINSEINDYAEKHGFQIIIGQLSTGNILYANETIDITEDILHIINEEYNGQSK